jgi:hypothetical protein
MHFSRQEMRFPVSFRIGISKDESHSFSFENGLFIFPDGSGRDSGRVKNFD